MDVKEYLQKHSDGSIGIAKNDMYVVWSPNSEIITMDGDFNAKDLRDLADHMEKYKKKT